MSSNLEKLELKTFDELDSPQQPPSDIVAYNELRSCADLYRMHKSKVLNISPEFQRDFVWKDADQTRFLDSLMKQLPIPSMCFALDYKKQEWLVIDGLQRMSTIIRCLGKEPWKLSKLEDIDPRISGVQISKLRDTESNLHQLYTRIENLSIPLTVLRCDFEKDDHMEYLFTIFHRLNSNGTKLTNQEIRNCIYAGDFNSWLKESDLYRNWRRLNKMAPNNRYRFRKQEIILRFLAFDADFQNYTGNLAKYLNDYMRTHRNASEEELYSFTQHFESVVDIIFEKGFSGEPLKKALPVTVQVPLMVGVSRNLELLSDQRAKTVRRKFNDLLKHQDFAVGALTEGLGKKKNVVDRMKTAIEILSE